MRKFSVTLWMGTISERPVSSREGSWFFAVDEGRYYIWRGGQWIAHLLGTSLAATVTNLQVMTNMNGANANIWTPVYTDTPAEDVDCLGRSHFRLVALYNPRNILSGSTQDVRWVSGSEVLASFLGLQSSTRIKLDTGWVELPEWARGQEFELEWQARSTLATDDPLAIGWRMSVR